MGGKFGGVFNLVIWQSGEKIPNLIPPILNPHDSGQLADRSSTYDYALHQHLKIAVFSPENAISGIPLSVERRFVLLTSMLEVQQTSVNSTYNL